jgi:hypothetical protein
MENLINRMNNLEDKRDNGTMTMEEELLLLKLGDLFEKIVYCK